ncbi:MAG: PhoH family protein [Myxococcales bacterium]|nr:PhoH family protein [Myxococcales bacterium]
MTERLAFDDHETFASLCGQGNEHLRLIERRLGVEIAARGTDVSLSGEPFSIELARSALKQLYGVICSGHVLQVSDIEAALNVLSQDRNADLVRIFGDSVHSAGLGRQVTPKGINQKRYVEAIRSHAIVFGIGPAGTGKTYLAMAMAVNALLRKEVKRIVLTRPAVEAGERLGFLPGDMVAKVNPYLRPLYDALFDMIEAERVERFLEKGVIEVAPLAFMRGRTLNDAFVVLDEAQNSTIEQMKMFLTRLGFHSKAVVTGDVTQVDLPMSKASGLKHAQKILSSIEGIAICRFTEADVVRHPLVQKIIRAYEVDQAPAAPTGPESEG